MAYYESAMFKKINKHWRNNHSTRASLLDV